MKKKFFSKKLSLKLITFAGLVFVVFIAIGLVREIVNRYMINQEINKVKTDIGSLEQKNKELSGLVDYLNTDSFKELQARESMGLQKNGETAVSIESMPNNNSNQASLSNLASNNDANSSNMKKWWNYFFSK